MTLEENCNQYTMIRRVFEVRIFKISKKKSACNIPELLPPFEPPLYPGTYCSPSSDWFAETKRNHCQLDKSTHTLNSLNQGRFLKKKCCKNSQQLYLKKISMWKRIEIGIF